MKYALISTLIFVCSILSAQRNGKPVHLDYIDLNGGDTVYVEFPEFPGYDVLSLELYFEQLGGTSDGTCYLLAGNDTNFYSIHSVDGAISAYQNDTITISAGNTSAVWIYGNPTNNFKFMCVGTENDTTRIWPNYIKK